SETMRSASTATDSIKTASAQLSTATDNAKGTFADYARTRDTFATMVAQLRQTFESAKQDAAMTSELVGKIQAAARELAAAPQQSEDYLKGVTEVVVGAHQSFRDNIDRTLGEGNRKFQCEVSNAVNLLS
ncbi:hypothetical protein B7L30_035835, partial [Burkholderia cenocepacia]|nr:hypothetical protein [Burkholderia cenocepacia]